MAQIQFDEIGRWSEIKLDIIRDYTAAYTKILSKNTYSFNFYYVDAFSGAGIHTSKYTKQMVEGSPVRALSAGIHFKKYFFVDLDRNKADFLRMYCENHFSDRNVEVKQGDCNKVIANIMRDLRYNNYDRVLCLLDPYGLHLDWEVIKLMGQKKIVDLFLNFPIMDMNRNAIWRDYEKVSRKQKKRMTQFWGDESWLKVAYSPDLQPDIFGDTKLQKQSNEAIINAFRDRLKSDAGFEYVLTLIPLKNSIGAIVYYLFFASQNATAKKIVSGIFKKHES